MVDRYLSNRRALARAEDRRLDPPEERLTLEDVELLHDAADDLEAVAKKVGDILPDHADDLRMAARYLRDAAGSLPVEREYEPEGA